MQLSAKGHIVSHPNEAVKNPYVLDFLKILQSRKTSEKGLEQKIIDNLQMFLRNWVKVLPSLQNNTGFYFVISIFISTLSFITVS